MKKTLIALALLAAAVISVAACSESTGAPAYVVPAMEDTTIAETTSELSTETAAQSVESESAARTEAETSFSAGGAATQEPTANTIQPTTTTTTKSTTIAAKATLTTRPSVQVSVTAAPYVSPATTTTTTAAPPVPQPALAYEVMGPEYLGIVITSLNEIRAEFGLALMREDPALMASSLEQAWKMAKAEDCFHSENPHGCESVAYYPNQFFPAKVVGERLTWHSPGFREPQNVRVGIAVILYDGYLYCVMQGDCE